MAMPCIRLLLSNVMMIILTWTSLLSSIGPETFVPAVETLSFITHSGSDTALSHILNHLSVLSRHTLTIFDRLLLLRHPDDEGIALLCPSGPAILCRCSITCSTSSTSLFH